MIHLRTPSAAGGYSHANALRSETAVEAAALDARILKVWEGHPHWIVVEHTSDFLDKAARVVELIRAELPACCRTLKHAAVPAPSPHSAVTQ